MSVECCRSPHEQMIMDKAAGKVNKFRATHERVFKILDKIETAKPQIDIERALYFTQGMQETEGQHLNLRWAKSLMKCAENMTVYIDDDQLLAGRIGYQGRYGVLYPELDGDFLDTAVVDLPTRDNSPFSISQADADIVVKEIAPYWKGKTYHETLAKTLPADVHALTYDDPDGMVSRFIVNETASFRSSNQWVHDFDKVLKRGFGGLRDEFTVQLEALDPLSPGDNVDKKPFLQAAILVCEAVIVWAKRHAALAMELAEKCADPVRKAELLKMAEVCNHVPEHPARTFYEACQSQWFTQMFSRLEQKTGTIISNGRMDQYLYPFYKQDIEAGILTDDQAIEYVELMYVGMAQYIDLYISPTGGAFNEGYAHWEAVTIGGQTPDGLDATNELTYLFLRSKREFPHHYPDLAARIHARAPERFLAEVAETIKEGSGFPKLINDEEVIPLHLAKGAKFEEIYDYSVSGCAEIRMPNRDTYTAGGCYINFVAALESVFFNGKMLKFGDAQLSIETGDVTKMETWEEFWNAYKAQHINFLKIAFEQQYYVIKTRARHFAAPMGSALHDLAMKHCIDIHQPYIPEGIDLGYFEFMGVGTLVDSMSAIKKFVFEEKKVTMTEVLEAMKNNFEGQEDLRALMMTAPCFGNNDPYADSIARDLDQLCVGYAEKYQRELGVFLDLRYVPFTSHVPFGKVVCATPNGRYAGTSLSDGSSASHGADKNGPTAVLLSNYTSKNFNHRERAARLVNIKFTPKCVQGEEGTQKLVHFIRTFCDLRLWHIQFNVVNAETLRLAQENPEAYRTLIVRIAGYSAYFCDLSKDLQNDLIRRTAHENM
ncbi:(2S)-3-sulfopropanediol dehydratase [Desulfotalea psychrophila]|uniref:Related to formate acetyltransferase n=1 Tax=Desulfotalea psychrophila (strain LSv54 / DSM 12343) TaxID=177439 RepID=Q6AIS4_DESPS|nr:glycyl radical protein [Desulfotalea psychrophila]CAG37756.1 related to formate acetyltransferase [Desulfotalea psychrophila LSv54]